MELTLWNWSRFRDKVERTFLNKLLLTSACNLEIGVVMSRNYSETIGANSLPRLKIKSMTLSVALIPLALFLAI